MLDHALKYAGMGWPVFPLAPRSKVPLKDTNGFKDATTDEKIIRAWWERWPDANIGLPTGHAFTVIDIDTDKDGDESLAALELKHGELPGTVESLTGGGGRHLLFDHVPSMANSTSVIGRGIDVRGEGGYIVAPPSVHKSGRGYEWEVSGHPDDVTLAEMPEWLRTGNLAGFNPDDHKGKATGEPVGVGQRNDALASLVGQWVSEGLDVRQISKQAMEWNAALESPMPDSEWCRIIGSIIKGHEARHPGSEVREAPEAAVSPRKRVSKLPEHLYRPEGYVGLLVDWMNESARFHQPELTLGNALAYFGAVIGRKVKLDCGLRSNIYCLGIGESGCGKDHSRKCIKRLSIAAGFREEILGGESVSSGAGMLSSLEHNLSRLFQFDEIGHFIGAAVADGAASHQRQIPVILTKLYTSAEDDYGGEDYANQKDRPRVVLDQPCACVYGTSVPSVFYDGITASEIRDGFLGRMTVFRSSNGDPVPRRRVKEAVPPKHLIPPLQAWWSRDTSDPSAGNLAAMRNQPITVRTQEAAEELFEAFSDECLGLKRKHRDGSGMDVLWSRGLEQAKKVALIIACGCEYESTVVTTDIAQYSIELIRFLLQDMVDQVGDNVADSKYGRDKLKLAACIKQAGDEGMTTTQLHHVTRSLKRSEREQMLLDLIDGGIIYTKIAEINGRGRPKKTYNFLF